MILAESSRPAAIFSEGKKKKIFFFYENEHLTERMWLIFLKHNMHLYQGSFVLFLTLK